MSESIITDPNAVANYLDEIRALADANKSALGFLPPRAYHDACMRGRLWVAIDDGGKLRGYLFFGGCYPRLRVFQIFVRPDFRYSGIAHNLLRKLRKYGENHNYLTITARVAEDLEANTFWKAIGFVITQRIARDTTKRSLNRYTLELDVPSLFRGQPSRAADAAQIRFPQPLLPTPSYVIDLNVFLDVVQSRDDGESSLVLSMGFDHEISLFVTSEFAKELERHTAGRSQDPVLEFARRLPTLPSVDSETAKPLVEELRTVLQTGTPKTGRRVANDASDLNQLASCIHHGAYGFVTRDAALLRHSDDLRRKYGLSIISPADFGDLFDDDAARHEPQQATVDQLDVRIADLDERDRSEVEKFLRDLGVDPRQRSSCLAPGTTQHPRLRRIVRVGPGLVGVGSWDGPGPRGSRNVHLYVKEDEPGAERAIDRLFLESMSASSHGRLRRLDLNIAPRQEKTREVAVDVGFRPPKHGGDSSGALTKVSFMGVVGRGNWSSFRRAFKNMTDFALQDDMPSWEALSNPDIGLSSNRCG